MRSEQANFRNYRLICSFEDHYELCLVGTILDLSGLPMALFESRTTWGCSHIPSAYIFGYLVGLIGDGSAASFWIPDPAIRLRSESFCSTPLIQYLFRTYFWHRSQLCGAQKCCSRRSESDTGSRRRVRYLAWASRAAVTSLPPASLGHLNLWFERACFEILSASLLPITDRIDSTPPPQLSMKCEQVCTTHLCEHT